MKHIVTFLFCIGLLAGCSQPRHETLVYYYPVVAETTQIPLTGDTAKTGQAAQATTQTNQTAAPVQTAVTTQTPVNITTLLYSCTANSFVLRTEFWFLASSASLQTLSTQKILPPQRISSPQMALEYFQ